MKELIERLRYPVLCTLTDRIEAADALERLTAEEKMQLEQIERLTSHDQFLADANKQWIADCARLTAELAKVEVERDALKAALQLIKANTNTIDWPDDINAAMQGAGK